MNAPLCLRCRAPMNFLRTASLMVRDNEPLLPVGYVREAGISTLTLDVWCCPGCGHVELFRHDAPDADGDGDEIAKVKCPRCGTLHDMDYPKCPSCGYDYNE